MKDYVFISGPYRSPTEWGVRQHIGQAIKAAAWSRSMGWIPFVPHAHYRDQHGPMTVEGILGECMDWLSLCDSIVMLPSWRQSQGACGELLEAVEMELDVVFLEHDVNATWGYRQREWMSCGDKARTLDEAVAYARGRK